MPSIGRAYSDSAGGEIVTGSSSVEVNNCPAAKVGSLVKDHGRGKHDKAKMLFGVDSVLVENVPVCVTGNAASCGHKLISNSNVEAG